MTTPVFLNAPPRSRVILFSVFLPVGYLVLGGILGPRFINLLAVGILFLPSLWFLREHRLMNGLDQKGFCENLLHVFLVATFYSLALHEILPWWEEIFPSPAAFQDVLRQIMHKGESWGWVRDVMAWAWVPAVCEETFFRGVMQVSLLAYFKPRTAIGISAFFFAAYHVNPWYFLFYFALGLYFGWVFFKTRHLGLSMLAHFINNVVAVSLFHLE